MVHSVYATKTVAYVVMSRTVYCRARRLIFRAGLRHRPTRPWLRGFRGPALSKVKNVVYFCP